MRTDVEMLNCIYYSSESAACQLQDLVHNFTALAPDPPLAEHHYRFCCNRCAASSPNTFTGTVQVNFSWPTLIGEDVSRGDQRYRQPERHDLHQ